MYNTRWKRNSLAHGGQVATDLQMIEQEHNLDRKESWSRGFRQLYGIEYEYRHDIIHDHTITTILNIHADALTLHIFRNHQVVSRAADLIEAWRIWAGQKSARYPFRDPVYADMLYDLLRYVLLLLLLLLFFSFSYSSIVTAIANIWWWMPPSQIGNGNSRHPTLLPFFLFPSSLSSLFPLFSSSLFSHLLFFSLFSSSLLLSVQDCHRLRCICLDVQVLSSSCYL